MGSEWKSLTRDDVISQADPDIKIESKSIADADRFAELQLLTNFISIIAGDPTVNLRYTKKKMAKLSGFSRDEINRILPKTPHEYHAEEENKLLNDGKMVAISVMDDHNEHLIIHAHAEDGKAKEDHMNRHKLALTFNEKLAAEQAAMASASKPEDSGAQTTAQAPGQLLANMRGENMGGGMPISPS